MSKAHTEASPTKEDFMLLLLPPHQIVGGWIWIFAGLVSRLGDLIQVIVQDVHLRVHTPAYASIEHLLEACGHVEGGCRKTVIHVNMR